MKFGAPKTLGVSEILGGYQQEAAASQAETTTSPEILAARADLDAFVAKTGIKPKRMDPALRAELDRKHPWLNLR